MRIGISIHTQTLKEAGKSKGVSLSFFVTETDNSILPVHDREGREPWERDVVKRHAAEPEDAQPLSHLAVRFFYSRQPVSRVDVDVIPEQHVIITADVMVRKRHEVAPDVANLTGPPAETPSADEGEVQVERLTSHRVRLVNTQRARLVSPTLFDESYKSGKTSTLKAPMLRCSQYERIC